MVVETQAAAIPKCRKCGRRHRSWRTVAVCRWPRSCWVSGEGRFASVSWCHPGATVELYADREKAEQAKRAIDMGGCGGSCSCLHAVLDLAGRPRRRG